MSYKKEWFHQVIEKYHEKTEVCEVLNGEVVKELEETGDVYKLSHTESRLKEKGEGKT
jgi:ppGpp synthetase/RelA/SpoT-type nucleotidyltranferase